MPISVAESERRQIEELAIKDKNGEIIDFKNFQPEGSNAAKFIDSLSLEGKKALYFNPYARSTFQYGVNIEGLDWALKNVDKIITATPPNNSDPYAIAKQYYNYDGQGGNIFGGITDFLKSAAPMILTAYAPGVGSSIGAALGGGAAATALGNAVVGGTISKATGGDFKKGAISSGVGSLLQTTVAPAVANSVGGGTLGNVASGALSGGVTSALKGGDVLTGAITGGVGGITKPLSETDASFMAADAAQLAKQGLSESQIADTLSSGYASTAAADLAASLAVEPTKLSVSKIEKELDKLSKTVGLTPVKTTDSELVAADALGITEAASRDNNFANTGLDNEADADFLAADAKQLAEQGLGTEQISNTLSAGYANTVAADLAADLATNGLSVEDITNSLLDNELLKGGVDIGAIEQNLTASGVDPLVAADVANKVALNPTISVDDLSKYTKDFYGDTLYDVEDLNFDPTEPPDTRPKGEILVDTTKAAVTNTPTKTSIPTLTPTPAATPPSGLFSQPNTSSDPFNFGANIAFGSSYQNPYARDRAERQSLISGLFNL